MKKLILFAFVIFIGLTKVSAQSNYYVFKSLPYSYNALEPWIDSTTMQIHYDKHHRGYYNKFVKAMQDNNLPNTPMLEIFSKVSTYPDAIRNLGGGYWNHEFFWESMTGQKNMMSEDFKKAIDNNFGSYDAFVEQFSTKANSLFGSGWTWLILTKDKKMMIVNTSNQDNPLMDIVKDNGTPLLCIDVWEHAYYLKYKNVRSDYVKNFWNVVDWSSVSKRYENAIK